MKADSFLEKMLKAMDEEGMQISNETYKMIKSLIPKRSMQEMTYFERNQLIDIINPVGALENIYYKEQTIATDYGVLPISDMAKIVDYLRSINIDI